MLVGLSAGSGAEERAEARRPEAQHLGVKQFEMPEGVAMISICQRPCTVMYSQQMTHRGREAGWGHLQAGAAAGSCKASHCGMCTRNTQVSGGANVDSEAQREVQITGQNSTAQWDVHLTEGSSEVHGAPQGGAAEAWDGPPAVNQQHLNRVCTSQHALLKCLGLFDRGGSRLSAVP